MKLNNRLDRPTKIRVDLELHRRLTKVATYTGKTKSAIIRAAVEKFLTAAEEPIARRQPLEI
jgi:predicted DNA-binding protein